MQLRLLLSFPFLDTTSFKEDILKACRYENFELFL